MVSMLLRLQYPLENHCWYHCYHHFQHFDIIDHGNKSLLEEVSSLDGITLVIGSIIDDLPILKLHWGLVASLVTSTIEITLVISSIIGNITLGVSW